MAKPLLNDGLITLLITPENVNNPRVSPVYIFVYHSKTTEMAFLGLLVKKKITEERLAHWYVNTLVDVVEEGWRDVSGLINDDPDFVQSPGLHPDADSEFLMIVLTGNLRLISSYVHGDNESGFKKAVYRKCAEIFECTPEIFYKKYREYADFLSRINHPSKNVLYSMSKAVFYKYNLNSFQADYFRNLNTPNPIFLKKMNDVLTNFLWDWDSFNEKFRIQ